MEPSDEELGAFNPRECQRLLENRKAVDAPRGSEQGPGWGPPGLRMAGWSRVDTVGQIRFWYRFCPGLAV